MQFNHRLSEEAEKGNLEIYDLKGDKIAQFDLPNNRTYIDINLSTEASGIYLFRFIVNDRIIKCDKLVINK